VSLAQINDALSGSLSRSSALCGVRTTTVFQIVINELSPSAMGKELPPSPGTIAELPPPDTKRWVIRRKAEVVAAVRNGVISLDDACKRYTLSIEEFLSWQRLIDSHGMAGLRVTRLQDYRSGERER
jgi:hypothetical protein